jgi:hypothetical protein
LSDQQWSALLDPRFAMLPIDHVRLVVAWDAALSDPAAVEQWLAIARQRRLTPLVAFGARAADRCPDSPCRAPTVANYSNAFVAFRARWPEVTEFTAWNEPNHPAQPTFTKPGMAARYHDALRRACVDCTVTAGDMLDSANMRPWFRAYRDALEVAPQVWAIHNYGDLLYDRPSYTEWLIGQVATPLWITETGGLVRFVSDGETVLPYDEARGASSLQRALALISANSPRVARAYLYNWRSGPEQTFDSGLVRANGAARPSLGVLQQALGQRPGPAEQGGGSDSPGGPLDSPDGGHITETEDAQPVSQTEPSGSLPSPAPASSVAARPARLGIGARRPLLRSLSSASVSCRSSSKCRGQLVLSVARLDGHRLPLGSRAFSIDANRRSRVRLHLRISALRQARRQRLPLMVATAVTREPVELVERMWSTAR